MKTSISSESFNKKSIEINPEQEVSRIVQFLQTEVQQNLHKRGAVLGISGGIDSSVVAALCARAFGGENILGLLMPEQESSPESETLAVEIAKQYGFETITEDISPALSGAGCYQRRDDAIRQVIPEFGAGWKSKITLPGSLLDDKTLNVFYLTAISPDGDEIRKRIPPQAFRQIVAASNFKQRTRMAFLYYHAERLNYAVIGTANKNEHAMGFFVKHGDGGVDLQPIQHLFKSQVYQLAKVLDIPEDIQTRTPTSDTYSAGSTQEEFFFRLPFEILDLVWFGHDNHISSDLIAKEAGISVEQTDRIIDDIVRKQRSTDYLRLKPLSLNS